MKKFKDLAIKYKILAGYFAVLIIFLNSGVYFIYSLRAIRNSSRQVELRNFSGIELITSLESTLAQIEHLTYEIERLQPQAANVIDYKKQVEIFVHKFKVLSLEFRELVKNEPAILEKTLTTGNLFEKYYAILKTDIEAQLTGNPLPHPEEHLLKEHTILEQLKQNLSGLRDEDVSGLSLALGRIDHLAMHTLDTYFWLLLVTYAFAIALACKIAKFIVGPIKDLVIAERKLGNGNLDYKIEVKSRDEIGTLQSGFMNMAQRLKQAYGDLKNERDGLEVKVRERTRDLELSHLHLKEVTDGIEEGIMLLDRNLKVVWANSRIMQTSGLKEGDVVGNFCYRVTHRLNGPCQAPYDICPVTDVLKTGKPITVIHAHYDKNGNKFYAEVSAYPLRNEAGEIEQFVHLSRDVTERIRLQEKLSETQSKLIQSAKMAAIGQLAGGVAHEINNPLTGVLNNVQLIKLEVQEREKCGVAEVKEILDVIEESALRCKRIIRSLLDFSRAGKLPYQPVEINEVLEKTLLLAEYEISLDNIKVTKDLASGLPLVMGEANQLQQVFLDIINNAVWALKKKKGGELRIKTEAAGDDKSVSIIFSDTGCGIPPENLTHIFEPFFTTKGVGEGAGLGLSICYGIIKEHNGKIEVSSEGKDKGAAFKITLPIVDALPNSL